MDRTRVIKEIKKEWEKEPETFPVFLEENPDLFPEIQDGQKRENEGLMEEFYGRMQKKKAKMPQTEELRKEWEREMEQERKDFLKKERILSLSEWIGPGLFQEFEKEIKHFLKRIREFDGTLKGGQIWQAMRNYMVYAMIVEMQGEKQNAADPVLAYSLLYPYTDNYIDNAGIAKEEKERYNRMIARKLEGKPVTAHSALEEKTCRLLDMIENAYEGGARKKVTGTLLQLLEAQHCSIRQQREEIAEDEVLGISIWKGGTSVLADYLFSTADWTKKEEEFYLRFGFALQLVDDLQDMEEDKKEGSRTLMTEAVKDMRLEERVNRLIWFVWNTLRGFEPKNPALKGFILKNCVEMILLESVINMQFFSAKYIKSLEPYLPFSAGYIKKMKKLQKKSSFVYDMNIPALEEEHGGNSL